MSARKAAVAQRRDVAAAARLTGDTSKLPLEEVVSRVRPTCLIGASGVRGIFTAAALQQLAAGMPPATCPPPRGRLFSTAGGGDASNGAPCAGRPIVLALSNPTSSSECTFQEAHDAIGGAAVFASGSQFAPVQIAAGGTQAASQANNSLIFPGLGTGAVLAGVREVADDLFLSAAYALANETSAVELEAGLVLPPTARIADAALAVAAQVVIDSASAAAAASALLSDAASADASDGGTAAHSSLRSVRRLVDRLRYKPVV